MSLVERIFPPAQLAALKHAVLSTSDEPAAKRRKIERQNSIRSHWSTDSGYNSENDSSNKQSSASSVGKSSVTTVTPARQPSQPAPPASPASSHSDEEDFTSKIALARARLYSNASMSVPSPAASSHSDCPSNADSQSAYEEYHSPVSVESLATTPSTSGCNLGTFISLGLAVTSHERNLLATLVPEPKAFPVYSSDALARWRVMRRVMARPTPRQPVPTPTAPERHYRGFAIGVHHGDDDSSDEECDGEQAAAAEAPERREQPTESAHGPNDSIETVDDFFNIEAACEEDTAGAS